MTESTYRTEQPQSGQSHHVAASSSPRRLHVTAGRSASAPLCARSTGKLHAAVLFYPFLLMLARLDRTSNLSSWNCLLPDSNVAVLRGMPRPNSHDTQSYQQRFAYFITRSDIQAKPLQIRGVAYAVALALAWYATSTVLSLYNKHVIGHKYGVLGGQPFPAPMLMSSMQFAMQYGLARLALASGIKRSLGAAPHCQAARAVVDCGVVPTPSLLSTCRPKSWPRPFATGVSQIDKQ
jgi:hypothetical protein